MTAQSTQGHQVPAAVLGGAEHRLGHDAGGAVHSDVQRQLRSLVL